MEPFIYIQFNEMLHVPVTTQKFFFKKQRIFRETLKIIS